MVAKALSTVVIDEAYMDRVRTYPLHTIRDDVDLDQALAVMDDLLDNPSLTLGEGEYLAVLGSLIEEYEREHVILPPVSGVDVLRYLMDQNQLTQNDIASLFGGNKSVVSEVLSGKRGLALRHIRQLAAHFKLPADVFIDAPRG